MSKTTEWFVSSVLSALVGSGLVLGCANAAEEEVSSAPGAPKAVRSECLNGTRDATVLQSAFQDAPAQTFKRPKTAVDLIGNLQRIWSNRTLLQAWLFDDDNLNSVLGGDAIRWKSVPGFKTSAITKERVGYVTSSGSVLQDWMVTIKQIYRCEPALQNNPNTQNVSSSRITGIIQVDLGSSNLKWVEVKSAFGMNARHAGDGILWEGFPAPATTAANEIRTMMQYVHSGEDARTMLPTDLSSASFSTTQATLEHDDEGSLIPPPANDARVSAIWITETVKLP